MKLLSTMDIHSKKDIGKLIWQFLKFGIVGVSNTLISLGIYYLFLWIDKDLYMWGNLVGWVVSVANAFFWNNRYVFKDESRSILKPLIKSYIAYGTSFLLSTLLLYIQVQQLGISELIAPLVVLVVTIPLNFIINKLWTFKK